MASTEILQSLLNDVRTFGPVIIDKRKLLYLLGWAQDRGGAWTNLISHWEAVHEESQSLHGVEIWDKIVLAKVSPNSVPKMVSVKSEWAEPEIKKRRLVTTNVP
jgi:hypothetical protein